MRLLVFLGICFLYSVVSFGQHEFEDHLCKIIESESRIQHTKLSNRNSSIEYNYDLVYQRCIWEINPGIRYIKGSITSYIIPQSNDFKNIIFDLTDSLRVDSIVYHKSIVPFTHLNNQIHITIASLLKGSLDSITVYYQGIPSSSGFNSFVQSTHNDTPIIWTLSEPYGASDWWPCKNSLSDKIDSLDVLITIPKGNKAASNGVLSQIIEKDTTCTYIWKHRYPITTYLVCLAITNYATFSNHVSLREGDLEILNYVFPEDSTQLHIDAEGIIPIFELFDSIIGPYPFHKEKYGHAQFGWGGGMEHQTMSFMLNLNHELMAHELAHQWFGDKITCGSWEDIWLNEGFATYMAGLTYEHMFDGFYWEFFKKSLIERIVSEPDGSVLCTDTSSVSRIFDSRLSYRKGAIILHQLRWVIGDSAFFSALKNYINDPILEYSFAKTELLIEHFERTSRRDLSYYFEDWYSGEGYPMYSISWSQTNDDLFLKIDQTQSHPSVSFFELPLPIRFKSSIHDTLIRIDNTSQSQLIKLTLPFSVEEVELDPAYWIITKKTPIVSAIQSESIRENSFIYPNPANQQVSIRILNQHVFTSFTYEIRDVNGTLIDKNTIHSTGLDVDISSIQSGFYTLKIISNNYTCTHKLAIEH